MAPVVVQTVEDYGEHLRQQGFSVEMDITHHVPQVRFDENAVSQAVMNLLDNARKYSGEPKSIAVRLWSEGDKVIFEVQDHGIGIPQDVQKRVFEPFYRVTPVTGHLATRGHGLGLFLVGHIMEAHGGTIEVRSDGQLGSRFQLVFPAVKKPAQSRFSFGYLKEQFAGAAAHTDHASTNAGGS
ncbi:MAG: HAMP domain-containing histidine kinase [Chloroflexi bacterium]|nr:HAMP domain-containing histidine kinase [Chloroflexota bacterium]